MITTVRGQPASVLGLAAYPEQDPACISRAFAAGINFFFFYGPGHKEFVDSLRPILVTRREDMIVASGSGSRKPNGLKTARRKIVGAIGVEMLDVFFAEYINPADDANAIFGAGGVLDELQRWKADGVIRYVGATAHDRKLARRLAEDARVDILMHRYNMAHRKAAVEVFPTALKSRTPVIAFTATRWGTLLKSPAGWSGAIPTAADCYGFCLAQPAVRLVLTAPKNVTELEQNLQVLKFRRMTTAAQTRWERYGNLIYKQGRAGDHDFESLWP
jgi:aryl-alcohol dehydrogenase-like predicted oxidoreductase